MYFSLKKLWKDELLKQIIIKGNAKLNLSRYVLAGNKIPVKKYAQIDETAAHKIINSKLFFFVCLRIWKLNKLMINKIKLIGIIEKLWLGNKLFTKK